MVWHYFLQNPFTVFTFQNYFKVVFQNFYDYTKLQRINFPETMQVT